MSISGRSDPVDVSADLRHETEKAYLIDNGSGRQVWVPKSMVEMERISRGLYRFTMPESLAIDNGLV